MWCDIAVRKQETCSFAKRVRSVVARESVLGDVATIRELWLFVFAGHRFVFVLHVAALVRPCMLADNCGRCVFLHRKSILLQKSIRTFVDLLLVCALVLLPCTTNQLELYGMLYIYFVVEFFCC